MTCATCPQHKPKLKRLIIEHKKSELSRIGKTIGNRAKIKCS